MTPVLLLRTTKQREYLKNEQCAKSLWRTMQVYFVPSHIESEMRENWRQRLELQPHDFPTERSLQSSLSENDRDQEIFKKNSGIFMIHINTMNKKENNPNKTKLILVGFGIWWKNKNINTKTDKYIQVDLERNCSYNLQLSKFSFLIFNWSSNLMMSFSSSNLLKNFTFGRCRTYVRLQPHA